MNKSEFQRPLSRVKTFTATLAGGMGACGALLMAPESITAWADEFRQQSEGQFQLNLWIPDPPPIRDQEREARQRNFLASWGPPVPAEMGDASL